MSWDHRREIRRQLEVELEGKQCKKRLQILKVEFPAFERFDTWVHVFEFLLDRSVSDPSKDDVIRPLVWSLQRENAPELNTVLLLVFWPALSNLAGKKSAWDSDADALWHDLQWAFLEAIHGLDVVAKPCGLAARMYSATASNLRTHYRREWIHESREVLVAGRTAREDLEQMPDEDGPDIERRALGSLAVDGLERAYRSGRLTHGNFRLIRAVDLDGVSLEEFAQANGLTYEAAKKRHQRALVKLRRVLQKK